MTQRHALERRLQYGTTTIIYTLEYAQRKTLDISVAPNQQVTVTAPHGSDLEQIEAILHKRAGWIVKKQGQFASYAPEVPPREYVSGETHRYLGRQYRLKVVAADQTAVKLSRGFLHIFTPAPQEPQQVKSLLEAWYRRHAQRVFQEQLAVCFPRVERLGVNCPTLAVRHMRTRWGSCTAQGKILLNLRLIQVPKKFIDYVILHELCHLKEHNHSPRFYALLDRVLPDWRQRRQGLNAFELG